MCYYTIQILTVYHGYKIQRLVSNDGYMFCDGITHS
jgi:hypothetical protein